MPYLQQWNTPSRLVWMTACHSSSVIFLSVRSRMMPALFTRMSSPPQLSCTCFMSASICAASRTSAPTTPTVGLVRQRPELRSRAHRRPGGSRRPGRPSKCRTHVAPARANAESTPAPIPRELPGDKHNLVWETVGESWWIAD